MEFNKEPYKQNTTPMNVLFHDELNEIQKTLGKLCEQRSLFIKSQLILNSVEQLPIKVKSHKMVEDKVGSLFLQHSIQRGTYSFTDGDNNTHNLLGIPFNNNVLKLSLSETSVIKANLKTHLSKKSAEFMKKLKILQKCGPTLLSSIFPKDSCLINSSKMNVLKHCDQLKDTIARYNITYGETNKLLEKAVQLKYHSKNEEISKFVDCLEESSNQVYLRARVFHLKVEYLILLRDNRTFDAVIVLYEKLKRKKQETSCELNRLESEIQAYENLKGTEFPEIIKQYTKIQNSLHHLKWTLKELRGVN